MIYEVIMSKGNKIKIDEEDWQKIQDNISSSFVMVKQGMINPSFIISITPTEDEEFRIKYKIKQVEGTVKYIEEEKVRALSDKMNIKNNLGF